MGFLTDLSASEAFTTFGAGFAVLAISLLGKIIINLSVLIGGSRASKKEMLVDLSRQGHELCLIGLASCFGLSQLYGRVRDVDQAALSFFVWLSLILFAFYVVACVLCALGGRSFRGGLWSRSAWLNIHIPMTLGLFSLSVTYVILRLMTKA